MVRATRIADSNLGLGKLTTVNPAICFFESGNYKKEKGEGWTPPFICRAQLGCSEPLALTAPTATKLWETDSFTLPTEEINLVQQ